MHSTTPQQRLRSLAIALILTVIALAYALALSIFEAGRTEDAARQCFSAAEAGYWQHTAVQLEATTIRDAFTECERLIERAELD